MKVNRLVTTHNSFVKRLLLGMGVVLCASSLPGCMTVTPASANRDLTIVMPEPLPDEAWPTRYPEPVNALINAADQADQEGRTGHARTNRIARILGYNNEVINHRGFGRGIVCELPRKDASHDLQLVYITNRLPHDDFHRAMEHVRPTRLEREELLRWYFRLQMPLTQEVRGLVLHLTSIGDRRFERSVSNRLRERGWAILHVEPGRFHIPLLHDENALAEGRPIAPEKLAANLDEYAADYAYAVEGVLAYIAQAKHALPQSPLVITGYSAGSLALPTIAALLGNKVDAAVFVGGGANVAGILINSKLTGITQRAKQHIARPHLNELRHLPDGYVDASRFDPYHMAKYLIDTPVLMLHARFDAIVPAAYGNLLYERLGRPERWSYPVGHAMMFWNLPSQSDRIAQWIEANIDASKRPMAVPTMAESHLITR